MLDDPRPEELLGTIAKFLRDEVVPQLTGATAFHARVAANAIDLVSRQIALEDAIDREENDRLVILMGQGGDTAELSRLLCTRLRAGQGEADIPGLMDHLWATTLAKIAVDQPGYASIAYAQAIHAAAQQGKG